MEGSGQPQWLDAVVKHAVPIALAVLTVAGVAGYAAGRAHLDGWNAAAGISPLAFNWEIQSVVLRGLSSKVLWIWVLCLVVLSGIGLLTGLFKIGVHALLERLSKKRPAQKPVISSSLSGPGSRLPGKLVPVAYIAFLPLAAAILWPATAALLIEVPSDTGEREFAALHVAATCRTPPRFSPSPPADMASLRKEGTSDLSGYSWVEVHSPSLARSAQGWLLQHQGPMLLLLTPDGVDLLHFADRPFRVSGRIRPPGVPLPCKAPAPADTKPMFKGDGPD
jgi:hypothetical protein